MTGNSLGSAPLTPFPDPPSHSGEEPAAGPLSSPDDSEQQTNRPDIATSSADDLNLLLVQPVPDPFLDSASDEPPEQLKAAELPSAQGSRLCVAPVLPTAPADLAGPRPDIDGTERVSVFDSLSSSENEFHLPVVFTPPPDAPPRAGLPPRADPVTFSTSLEDRVDQERHGISWSLLLVASYASAVTLSLIWILWTGRALSHRRPTSNSSTEAPAHDSDKGSRLRPALPRPARLPAQNLTTVETSIRLGELELVPVSISRRGIELERLDGFDGETRQIEDVLVLSVRLTNRAADLTFAPLEPAFVRSSGSADDDSFIETATGKRIPMYQLAPESEWSIHDQRFPVLKPGEAGETILVSEPVQMNDLTGPLIWHIKIRTGTYRTDVLGVQFTRENVLDGGF